MHPQIQRQELLPLSLLALIKYDVDHGCVPLAVWMLVEAGFYLFVYITMR